MVNDGDSVYTDVDLVEHPAPWAALRLDEDEHDSLSRIAEDIDVDPYGSLLEFTEEAVKGWRTLRPDTRARVGQLADGSSERPELYVTNLPRHQALEPTPTIYKAGRTTVGILSEYLMMVFSVGLGYPISYADQRDGNLFHDVFPTRRNASEISSQSSASTLGFHTEMFFHPVAPDFLVLHCLRSDPDYRAITRIASISDIEANLSAHERETLRRPLFAVDLAALHGSYTHEGHKIREEDPRPAIAVISATDHGERLRFEPELMTPLTAAAYDVLHCADTLAAGVAAEGKLERDSLLLIDNRRAAHSRSPFEARFDGTDRWLRRMMLGQGSAPPRGFLDQPDFELARAWSDLGVRVEPVLYSKAQPPAGSPT